MEQICTNGGMTWEWSGEGLKPIVRPAIVEHPLTGQPAWFNQADNGMLTAGSERVAAELFMRWIMQLMATAA